MSPIKTHVNITIVCGEAGLRARIPVPVFLAIVVKSIPLI